MAFQAGFGSLGVDACAKRLDHGGLALRSTTLLRYLLGMNPQAMSPRLLVLDLVAPIRDAFRC